MKRTRHLTLLALLALLAVLAASCGDDDGAEPADDPDSDAASESSDTGPSDTGSEATDAGSENDDAAVGGPLEKDEIVVGTLPITDLMQFYVADAEGFFEDEGLTVQAQSLPNGAAVAAGVQSGAIDVGWSNSVSIYQAHSRGLPFQYVVGGLFQGPDHWTQALVVAPDSEIAAPEDLVGRRVALNSLGNINELVLKAYLEENGLDPEGVEIVELPFPDMATAVQSGNVDAALPTEPFVTGPVSAGLVEVLDPEPFAVLSDEPFVAGWFASEEWSATNPNTAAAFSRAITTATAYLSENPDVRQELIPEYTQVSAEAASEIAFGVNRAELTAEDLQSQIDLSAEFGLIPEAFDAAEILAPSAGGSS